MESPDSINRTGAATKNTVQARNLRVRRKESAAAEELQDARSEWTAPTLMIQTRIGRRLPKGSADQPPKKVKAPPNPAPIKRSNSVRNFLILWASILCRVRRSSKKCGPSSKKEIYTYDETFSLSQIFYHYFLFCFSFPNRIQKINNLPCAMSSSKKSSVTTTSSSFINNYNNVVDS